MQVSTSEKSHLNNNKHYKIEELNIKEFLFYFCHFLQELLSQYNIMTGIDMTKLEKTYISSHLYEICVNVTFFLGICTFFIAISPLAVALIFALYAFVALWVTIIIVVITIGLVFTDHSNPLYKIIEFLWSGIVNFDLNVVTRIQEVAAPIILSFTGVFLLLTFITTLCNKSRYGKTKPIVFMIITLVFLLIGIFVYVMAK